MKGKVINIYGIMIHNHVINLQEFTEYKNLEECINYLCDYITNKGPYDGLLGFSQVHAPNSIVFFIFNSKKKHNKK